MLEHCRVPRKLARVLFELLVVVQCLDQNLYFAMNTVLYFSLRRRNIHTTEKSVYNNPFGSSLTFVAGFDPDCTINESSASELSRKYFVRLFKTGCTERSILTLGKNRF